MGGGAWSGCLICSWKMISRTWCTVPESKVPSEGQPTWKVGHSVLQKVINLFFFTSTDRFCALDLKSEKRSVIRDKGVEVVCPMITEKNTGDQMSTQRAETVPALTQTQQTDNKCTSAKNTGLGLPRPPFFNFFLPLRVSYRQDTHRASCLPSTMPGIGLTLDLTRINTGVQRSLLLVRKPLLPGECYSSQLKGSWTSPQMLCPESEFP